jgi:ubiquinone/menaquinone biosynthesis C-methylase UbiE
MTQQPKNYFQQGAEAYNKFRPSYPPELIAYVSSISSKHSIAWDCATGNGQAAVLLADYFSTVIATDASSTQIQKATKTSGVHYQVATAEHSGIQKNSIDLITVAQAFHWFNQASFTTEARRVLKDKGVIAIWTYNLLSVEKPIDALLQHFYTDIVGEYWPKERRLVEEGYKNIHLPFSEIKPPTFNMTAKWDFEQLLGYLATWSASKEYQRVLNRNPMDKIHDKLLEKWGPPEGTRTITWPLSLKVWQK